MSQPFRVRSRRGLIVQHEGSHATPSASAASAATTASSHTFEKVTAFTRRVSGSTRIARLRARGLHLTQRRVTGGARVMFLGDLMLQTRCFARYTPRKRGRCGGDESGGRKCDDRCLHFQSSLLGIKKPTQRAEVRSVPLMGHITLR
jgi:hypothetical protein